MLIAFNKGSDMLARRLTARVYKATRDAMVVQPALTCSFPREFRGLSESSQVPRPFFP